MDANQKMRYSESEIATIQKMFGTPDLALLLRSHLLQLPLAPEEVIALNALPVEEVNILKKFITPVLTKDVPLTQSATLFVTLQSMLKEVNPDVGLLWIQANDLVKDFLLQQVGSLGGDVSVVPKLKLEDLPKETVDENDPLPGQTRVVRMIAYNDIIKVVEGSLSALMSLATPPQLSPEEQAKKQAQDSAK